MILTERTFISTWVPYQELRQLALPQVNISLGRVVVWLSSPAAKSVPATPCSHSTACKDTTRKKHYPKNQETSTPYV
jgi:hypothetical protein